jgi:hypothetical protein
MAQRNLAVSWQDPMALAQAARSMSGLDFLRAVRDALRHATTIL